MEVRTGKTLTSLTAANLMNVEDVLFITKKKAISSIEGDYELLAPNFELDVINYEEQKPYVKRELKSSSDNFKETIIELPIRKFSFIKNDIKIHNKEIYTITVSESHLNLKSYN